MRRRTYVLWKRILTRFFILAIAAGVLYIYFHTRFFTIRDYHIVGAPEAYTESLKQGMVSLANKKIYKVLPGNRIMSYHKIEISALIMDKLPNTRLISIYPSGLHTITVKIQSYTPVFATDDMHAISSDGTIYREINPLTDYPRLETSSTTVVTPMQLVHIAKLIENVQTVLFPIKTIAVDEYGDVRMYSDAKKSYVAFSLEEDTSKVWSNIVSAIDTDPLKKTLAAEADHLEYIDARFGNKVFYKFTKGGAPAIIPDTNDHATSPATTTLR